ncbi:MAG: hypothetical protein AAF242_09305 [Bacteroidota bacterium]
MSLEELKETVRQYIARSKTKEAIQAIIQWAKANDDDQLKNDAILLEGNLSEHDRNRRLGLLTNSEITIGKNRINHGVLGLLDSVDDGPPIEIPPVVTTTPAPDNGPKVITIFLASSRELEEERREFEIFLARENSRLVEQGIYLKLQIWEDFIDAMSRTRLQDEYNKAIRETDIFVSLFFTKVGQFTQEEFETAFGQFKETGKPLIYTYFKEAQISIGSVSQDDMNSLFGFKERLNDLGHFWTTFKNIDDLKFRFKTQLDKILPNLLK